MQEVPLSPEIQGGTCRLCALGARATLLLSWDALTRSFGKISTFGQVRHAALM